MIKVSDQILKKTHKWVILIMIVFGMMKMVLKKEKEKALYKLKYLNKNFRANVTGPSKKYKKWLKSLAFLKAKSTNGVGIKRKKIWNQNSIKKENLLKSNIPINLIKMIVNNKSMIWSKRFNIQNLTLKKREQSWKSALF